jgi:hypothetical protein
MQIARLLHFGICEQSTYVTVALQKRTGQARNEQRMNLSVDEFLLNRRHILSALELDIVRHLHRNDIFSRRYPRNRFPWHAIEMLQISFGANAERVLIAADAYPLASKIFRTVDAAI